MKKKRCPKCGEVKPVDEFYKNKSRKDGLSDQCKECTKTAVKKHRDANPKKVKAANKKWQEGNPEKAWAIGILNSHRRKGYEIQITSDELVEIAKTIKTCPICGCELAWGSKNKSGKRGPQPNSPTLNRIDNCQKITTSTIQILCHRCNCAKQKGTTGELILWATKIADRFRKGDIG